jgi:peroxiredoxin
MTFLRSITMLALCATLAFAGSRSGRRVPSFALPDSNAKYVDVLDLRGKPLLIEIMRTDCPHCVTLTRTLSRVQAKYGNRVNILAIVNPPDEVSRVGKYIATHKITYPILFDVGTFTANIMQATPARPSIDLPHLFLIDANGMIADDFGFEGNKAVMEGDGLFAIIDRLLAPPAPAKAAPPAKKK